jgi:Ni,Fe-hydrogenase III large subunit
MTTKRATKTIGEVIDELERIREELLTLQRSLEKMEFAKTAVSKAGRRRARPWVVES